MSSDDHAFNSHYPSSRKSSGPSKGHGYSPSTNYNYGNTSSHGNSSHSSHGSMSGSNKQHHRKPGGAPFKRDGHGSSDKLIKQNDMIIQLLKEIRDRLPEPPNYKKDNEDAKPVDEISPDSTASVDNAFEADDVDEDEIIPDDVEGEENEETQEIQDFQETESPRSNYPINDDDDLDNKVNGNC
jgi:hypothetical protein